MGKYKGLDADMFATGVLLFEMFKFYNPIGRYGEFSVGAGLSYAKYLIEELGGEIEVNSDLDEGTICTFSIPK